MTPKEMQERIEHLREDAHMLYSIADEPGQTPVHPEGVVERDEVPATQYATDEEVTSIFSDF